MRTVVGTMTGTSMDGIDAVATEIKGHGLSMIATFQSMQSLDFGDFQKSLRALTLQTDNRDGLDSVAQEIGDRTRAAIDGLKLAHIDLIAVHGQTIFHKPPKSIQLVDAKPITQAFDCTVLTDPRQQDLQLGGQGAPITPLADWIMFRNDNASTAIVNLGGFCNVTILPAGSAPENVHGFDVCCCNLLLNAITRDAFSKEFDDGGAHALRGTPDERITKILLDTLNEQKESNRSLGTCDDLSELAAQLRELIQPEDLLASATSAIGQCITESVQEIENVILAGGGVHNESLCQSIRNDGTTAAFGVPTQAREGMAMAILGALAQDGISITLPQITGRRVTEALVGWTQVSP